MKFKKCSNCLFYENNPEGYEEFPNEGYCFEYRIIKQNKTPACEKYEENYFKYYQGK
jgi:hypothetical protein